MCGTLFVVVDVTDDVVCCLSAALRLLLICSPGFEGGMCVCVCVC